jgi:hypothetical protein
MRPAVNTPHRRAPAVAADVADLAHDLAGAVGVDEGSDLPRDCGIEQLQFVEAVARRVEPLQQHDAAAVLQFGADVLGESGAGGQREVVGVIVCQPRPRALACRTARSISANCATLSRRRQRDELAILRPCHTHAPLIGWISCIARSSLLLPPHTSGRARRG